MRKDNCFTVTGAVISSWVCVFGLFLLRIVFDPEEFADYDSYLIIIKDMFGAAEPGPYEYFSYKIFNIFSNVFDSNTVSLYWLYIFHFVFIACIYLYVVSAAKVRVAGVVITLAMFSSLLFFVTLRAAPAYVLVMSSVLLYSRKKKIISALSILAAAFFHISAIIPLLVFILIQIKKLNENSVLSVVAKIIYVLGVLHIISFIFELNIMPEEVGLILQGFDSLDKYSVYANPEKTFSIFHYLYLLISIIVFTIFRKFSNNLNSTLKSYGHFMMLVYCIMMVSPVTAFRISIFFYLPVLMVLPWKEIFNKYYKYVISLVMPAVFVNSFYGVLIK